MAKSTSKPGSRKNVGRYVAPEVRGKVTAGAGGEDHSPRWYGALIVALLALGTLLIVLNYLRYCPLVSSWYLVTGLFIMFSGFFLATRYK